MEQLLKEKFDEHICFNCNLATHYIERGFHNCINCLFAHKVYPNEGLWIMRSGHDIFIYFNNNHPIYLKKIGSSGWDKTNINMSNLTISNIIKKIDLLILFL